MKTTSLLLIAFVATFAAGCGGFIKGKAAAEQGVADFHKSYNEGKFSDVYSATHPAFRGGTTEQQFLEFVGAVQRKLGKVTSTSTANFNIRSFNLKTTVVLVQNTAFEHGIGTETFTFHINGEKALLVEYNINSKDLILR